MNDRFFRIADYVCNTSTTICTELINKLLEENIFKYEDIENYIDTSTQKPYEIDMWLQIPRTISLYVLKLKKPLLKNEYGRYWGIPVKDAFYDNGNYVPIAYQSVFQLYAVDICNAIKQKSNFFNLPDESGDSITTELVMAYKGLFHIPRVCWKIPSHLVEKND